jgi:3-hydroxyisobutyrate dehydrogenase-like beta-hydroxyacid dehydrogenase
MLKEFGPVGVIGLGNMGGAMSTNLIKDGFEIYGADPVAEKCEALTKAGGTALNNACEVAKRCRYIIMSLPSYGAFNAVSADLAESCENGTIILETSTMPIELKLQAQKLLAGHGIILLDAPLSGTGAQAKNKDLVVLGSGDKEAYEKCIPIINGFARSEYFLGDFGNGMKMKFVANQLVAIHNVAAAEAVLFGTRMGMDPDMVVKVIGDGAGSSRMFQVRGPVMVKRTWSQTQISNNVFHKDIVLIEEALEDFGCPSPLFSASIPIYTAARASGHGEDDTSSVFEILERMTKGPE